MNRTCQKCGKKIDACMGFVSAGDLLRLMAEEPDRSAQTHVRELCGICVLTAPLDYFSTTAQQ